MSHLDQANSPGSPWGFFWVPRKGKNVPLKVVAVNATPQLPWEHVSVSLPTRCPTWEEMCLIKELFWDDEDVVIQYHPAKSNYVNMSKYVLHLWRNPFTDFPTPPIFTV